MIEVEHVPAHSLLPSNTEMPGIDCKVSSLLAKHEGSDNTSEINGGFN